MCVICDLGKIVERLEKLAVREVRKNEKENSAKAVAAAFFVQAAQASLAGEWGIIRQLAEKAHQAVEEALEQAQCSDCGNRECPRDHSCEGEDTSN